MFKVVDGKKFKCIQCGKCCKWGGFVFLTDEDVVEMSDALTGGDIEGFLSEYTSRVGPRSGTKKLVLRDKDREEGDWEECIFLKDKKCSIYKDRPRQCKDYPKTYDSKCPGFNVTKEVEAMSGDMAKKVAAVNKKLSVENDLEKAVLGNFYSSLKKEASSLSVASRALESGSDSLFDTGRIKVASLDDLFAFNRVDDKHLIHKSTRDLWSIEADENGDVHIARLFESGKPIKG